jgi:predicted nucleic acid-binding protein
MAIAIDTNVVLYAFDGDAPGKRQIARSIPRSGLVGGLATALQFLGEVFAVLTRRRKWSAGDARAVVTSLISSMPICMPSPGSLQRAMALCDLHTVSFWDAQIVTAAAEYGCNTLLSEDLQDGRRFTATDVGRALRIINPFHEKNATCSKYFS